MLDASFTQPQSIFDSVSPFSVWDISYSGDATVADQRLFKQLKGCKHTRATLQKPFPCQWSLKRNTSILNIEKFKTSNIGHESHLFSVVKNSTLAYIQGPEPNHREHFSSHCNLSSYKICILHIKD